MAGVSCGQGSAEPPAASRGNALRGGSIGRCDPAFRSRAAEGRRDITRGTADDTVSSGPCDVRLGGREGAAGGGTAGLRSAPPPDSGGPGPSRRGPAGVVVRSGRRRPGRPRGGLQVPGGAGGGAVCVRSGRHGWARLGSARRSPPVSPSRSGGGDDAGGVGDRAGL